MINQNIQGPKRKKINSKVSANKGIEKNRLIKIQKFFLIIQGLKFSNFSFLIFLPTRLQNCSCRWSGSRRFRDEHPRHFL